LKYFLIMNPGSRGGKSKKMFHKILCFFKKNNLDYDYYITDYIDDAYNASKRANENSYDVIIAVGGDGTINRVVSGFYDENGLRLSKAFFGVIYTGTSPDFCKNYNIPIKTDNALQCLLKDHREKINIGRIIHGSNETGKSKTGYFAVCMNAGIGASLAGYANSGIRKIFGDFFGTFFSLIRALLVYKAESFKMSIDDKIYNFDGVFNISVGKGYYVASGIKINNNLSWLDKRFYIVVIKGINIFKWRKVFKLIYSGNIIKEDENFSYLYGKHIKIFNNKKCPDLEYDGDPIGYLPCKIENAKEPLEIINNGIKEI